MSELFYEVFNKYGLALSSHLYPSQMQGLQEAIEEYAETGKCPPIGDSYTELAFDLIMCDIFSNKNKEGEKDETQKQAPKRT